MQTTDNSENGIDITSAMRALNNYLFPFRKHFAVFDDRIMIIDE